MQQKITAIPLTPAKEWGSYLLLSLLLVASIVAIGLVSNVAIWNSLWVGLLVMGVFWALAGLVCLGGTLSPAECSETSVWELEGSVQQVWALLTEVERQPEWNSTIVAVEKLSDSPESWALYSNYGYSDIAIVRSDSVSYEYEIKLLAHMAYIKLFPFYQNIYIQDIKLSMNESYKLESLGENKSRMSIHSTARHGIPKARLYNALFGNKLMLSHRAYTDKIKQKLASR